MDSDRQAISDPALSDGELKRDTIALFKFVTDTLDRLTEFLRDRRESVPKTSYAFIQSNIQTTFEVAAANVKSLRQNVDAFSNRVVSWPLILRSLHGQEERHALFDFRDDIVEHSADLRQASFDFTTNISLAFAGYTLVYEILENFGVSVPFILIESNSFSEADLQDRLFSEYAVAELFLGATGPRPSSVPIETLTYSGMEMHSPEALLLLGHECFHIVEKFAGSSISGSGNLLRKFCQQVGAEISDEMLERCNEAFIDILASMYLGPAYIVALLRYFLKTHPASDEDHVETWSRVKILSKLATQMSYDTLSRVLNAGDFDNVLETLKRHTTPDQQNLAQSDFQYLEKLLRSGLVGYVSDFFEQKDVKIYNVFYKYWTDKEVGSAVDRIDLDMLLFCLGENIPMAVRPSILLNAVIDYEKELVNLHPKTVTGSIKKWYVRHYYRKSK